MNTEKQKKYEAEMIATIKKLNWMRWSHIVWDALSFSRPTAYNYKLSELDTIKEAFGQNRSGAVNYLLQKWLNSDNATLQIAAMRIVADDEDRQRLSQTHVDVSTKGESINLTPEDRAERIKQLKSELLANDN